MRHGGLGLTLALLLGMLSAAPAADVQSPGKVFRIGMLLAGSRPSAPDWKQRWPFLQALRELGWVEGQSVVFEDRWAPGKTSRLPEMAAELVRLNVDLIVTVSWPAAAAAKNATTTIPIVIVAAGDPVGTGLVQSLARPGGNVTGITGLEAEVSAKRLELLKEAVPNLSRVAVLWNSADGAMTLMFREIQKAARTLGVAIRPLGVQEPEDFDQAFTAMIQERPDALVVISDPMVRINRQRILDFAAGNRLPAIYTDRPYAVDGGLMSYGPSFAEMFRRGAAYVDKILKGAKPADLPVEQPTRFELVVNLKTAKALGLTIPPSILIRTDEAIQ